MRADGKATRFMESEALAGLRAYFNLARYLAPQVRHLNGLEPDDRFLADQETALTISGPWLFCAARTPAGGEAAGQIRVGLPPGAPFVGGSNLVIWKYSRNPEAAVKLIRFLTQSAAQVTYGQYIGLLPARMEALGRAPFSTDPFWQTAIDGLKNGKSFPIIRLWGLVEDRLKAGLSAVWSEVLADPDLDPEVSLVKHLAPLASRLDPLLEQG